jgi:uncharacterized membrane protein
MTDLTVWRYETPLGVDAGEVRLKRLEEQGVLKVEDAAAVVWMPEADRPKVRRLRHGTARAASAGGFWGGLVGLVVLGPVAGAAAGAAAGGAAHQLRAAGIDDEVVRQIRAELKPGTSALLVLSSDLDVARLRAAFKYREATLIHARLSDDAPAELRELLEEE